MPEASRTPATLQAGVTDKRIDLSEALRLSFLAPLSSDVVEQLTRDALRLDVPAGATIYRQGDAPRLALVAEGLLRVYLTSTEGRQVTMRYAGTGSALGIPTAAAGPVETSVQALTDATVFVLNIGTVESLGRSNAQFAWAVAGEIARRLYEVLEVFGGNVFGSLRQRVARHVLDIAAEHQHGATLMAPVSQQGLADAVGTVREVVARVLRELRDEGLIATSRRGIAILDPRALTR